VTGYKTDREEIKNSATEPDREMEKGKKKIKIKKRQATGLAQAGQREYSIP